MICPGDRLENPVTGEVLVFHETATQTRGELVRFETIVEPDGFVAAAHVHPAQTERFEVLVGTVGFRVGRETVVAGPGEVLLVPAGTPHRFWNAGSDEARFLCEIRPALQFESLIETMFTLAAEGRTGRRGLPGPLQLAVVAKAHFDTVRLPFPPAPLQRAALAVGAPLGKMLGYEATAPRRQAERARRYDRGGPHGRPARMPQG
jgi:mannose-6-phosphate isomerase-like protein (cupin superfamily)